MIGIAEGLNPGPFHVLAPEDTHPVVSDENEQPAGKAQVILIHGYEEPRAIFYRAGIYTTYALQVDHDDMYSACDPDFDQKALDFLSQLEDKTSFPNRDQAILARDLENQPREIREMPIVEFEIE